MPNNKGTPSNKTVAVDTVAKLLKKLGSIHDIGTVYEYKHNDQLMLVVDSSKAGRLRFVVPPTDWSTKIAEEIWLYEVDTDTTADPTTVDLSTEEWVAILPTDASEDEDTEESEDEDDNELDADSTEDELFNGDTDTEV